MAIPFTSRQGLLLPIGDERLKERPNQAMVTV
jgi:hypothetical protein